jgi:hypothetical protein
VERLASLSGLLLKAPFLEEEWTTLNVFQLLLLERITPIGTGARIIEAIPHKN